MPKFGLKYFLGSFLLSLVAVFAATKAYLVLSNNTKKVVTPALINHSEAHNIELVAINEENDPLYEKFNKLDQLKQDNLAGLASEATTVANSPATDTLDVAYKTTISEEESEPSELIDDDEDELIIANTSEIDEEKEEELVIADASKAKDFTIPLLHHFKTESGTVTVSNRADDSQVALASSDVSIENLGTADKAAATEKVFSGISDQTANITPADDDPWEVAKAANEHTTKNTLHSAKTETSFNVSAMDKSSTEVAENTNIPYKMQKNLLVPIPEDIMNETDMTPQLSISKENREIEEQLRAKKKLPEGNPMVKDNPLEKDDVSYVPSLKKETTTGINEDDETSKSLTDSIAAWFSGNKKKEIKENTKKIDSQSNRDQSNSIFKKLLGIGSDKVTPTELKLSFQPNRAEISGQTLEWLHAFSANAVKYDNVLVEIRLSNTAPYDLQKKRLKLLYRILANNGVEYNKVNIIFTDREPNSFIIRNVRYATEEEQQKALAAKTYSPWY